MIFYMVGFVIVIIPVIYVVYGYYYKAKLLKKFKGNYVDWEHEDYDFESLKYIRKYWDIIVEHGEISQIIDETTWNDLDMAALFFKINVCQSSIGEEYLYARLRSISFDEKELTKFGDTVNFMDKNTEVKAEALYILHVLGKNLYNNIHTYIYEISDKPIKNIKTFYILVILLLVFVSTCFFTPAGFVPALISVIVNIIVYYKNKFKLDMNLNSMNYISSMIYCAYELSKLDYGEQAYGKCFKSLLRPLRKYNRLHNSLTRKANSDIEFLLEYVKIVFMWDFINYNKAIRDLSKHIDEFHQIYKLIGELDSAIAICEYRKTLKSYSVPKFWSEENIIFNEVYHPLIKEPVCNSLDWKNNSIITGSNASGKSTFIKALAITAICAQSIYICFAQSYKGKMSLVMTSMAVKDRLCEGESYFIAEIKSLKRILDNINHETRLLCFIDEILKGTNTVERISSSAAILVSISEKNCMVMAASHDIELTEILSLYYDNLHFREQTMEKGIFFDYKLYKGASKTRNAIKLLQFMGFDNDMTELAVNFAVQWEVNRKWNLIDKPIVH